MKDGATLTQPGQDTTLPNETTTVNHDQTQVRTMSRDITGARPKGFEPPTS
jgi:hypothetical protein